MIEVSENANIYGNNEKNKVKQFITHRKRFSIKKLRKKVKCEAHTIWTVYGLKCFVCFANYLNTYI